jgi:hypothetical protein
MGFSGRTQTVTTPNGCDTKFGTTSKARVRFFPSEKPVICDRVWVLKEASVLPSTASFPKSQLPTPWQRHVPSPNHKRLNDARPPVIIFSIVNYNHGML